MSNTGKITKTVAKVLACAVVSGVILCLIFQVHLFTFNIKTGGVSRVDCIDGYYVAVYEYTVCGYDADGQQCVRIGNCQDITDYLWKHKEMFGIVPYRRFLCFSKEVEPELYFLEDRDRTVIYGMMFVLRTENSGIHYYYRRAAGTGKEPDVVWKEILSFRHDGQDIPLNHYCSFTSDIDFTTGEQQLYLGDEPCCFFLK